MPALTIAQSWAGRKPRCPQPLVAVRHTISESVDGKTTLALKFWNDGSVLIEYKRPGYARVQLLPRSLVYTYAALDDWLRDTLAFGEIRAKEANAARRLMLELYEPFLDDCYIQYHTS